MPAGDAVGAVEPPRDFAGATTGIGGALCERRAELAALAELVEAAATAGAGGTVVVQGMPGIGKTVLADRLAALAGAAGMEVLVARGGVAESGAAFGVVRQLLAHRVGAAPAAEREALLGGAAGWGTDALGLTPADPGRDDAARRLGLYWLCAGLAERAPLLLVVDDAHWADPPSLEFLAYLAHRVCDLPVVLGVTARDAPATDALRRLAGAPRARVLRPAPLSEAAVAELMRRRGPAEPAPGEVADWYRLTGGNPLLVTELLAGGRPAARLEGWVATQLAALGQHARVLAEACSVLDDGASLALAAELAGLSGDDALGAAGELLTAALLAEAAPARFRHPLVREAVAATVPPARAMQLHRAAARCLARDGAEPGVVAHHLLAVPPLGDPAVPALLLDAARDAAAHGDVAAVRARVARALAEPPTPGQRAELLILDGRAAVAQGALTDAAAALREALTLATDLATRRTALRDLVGALLTGDRLAETATEIDGELAALAAADPEQALAVEAEILSASRHSIAVGVWRADRLRRFSGRLTGATAGERLLLANLGTQVALDGGSAEAAADLAARAAAGGALVGEQTADALAVYQVVWVLLQAERWAAAARLLDVAHEDAARRGSAVGFVLASLFRSYLDLMCGDLRAAEEHAGSALAAATTLPDPMFHVPAVVAGVLDVHRERGGLADAERLARGYPPAAALPDSTPYRLLLYGRGLLRLAAGRPVDALADLAEFDRREESCHVLATPGTPRHVALAHAHAAVGDRAEALRCARAATAAADAWGTGGARARALHAVAAAQPPGDAVGTLREALAVGPLVSDAGWIRHDLGVASARLGRRSEAGVELRAALDVAHRTGAGRLEEQARTRLVELGYRPRRAALTGADALTGAERRVAGLAAAGHGNREIAQALFVTRRTVETHLTSAYRKLGVRSRSGLAAALPEDRGA
ncbi:LuxR family transcriptional regulator [Pseudonocardia sp. C8]|uniref:helix-turn-helix transcriptional regulator n=1 Tax=Pseudonocardia sp. C8 TaxID=2762759 RepID=UPI002105E3E5|nr:LuxR family transcriptional regulator [Pseudonocardia sp. C8]